MALSEAILSEAIRKAYHFLVVMIWMALSEAILSKAIRKAYQSNIMGTYSTVSYIL